MKCRSVAWAAVLLSDLLMVFRGKNTRGNTSTNQEQTSQSAPQSTAAPATGDTEKASATSAVTLTKKKETPSPTVNHQEGQLAPLHPPPIVLSAGAVLTVRLNEAVDATNGQAGSRSTGQIEQAAMQQRRTVIPLGSDASGVVEQSQQGGKIKGSSSLSLRLTSITVANIAYPISTSLFLELGKGKVGRTTKICAGGVGAGELVGGLAGGKGALIDSAIGAGSGIAGSGVKT
jgi:cytoskeletal protein RodZ